jgi:hypothetical protein
MKTLTKSVLSIIMLGVLSIFTLRAQTVTVLEGFEESAPGMPPGTTTNGYSPNLCTFSGARGYCNTNIALFTAYGGRSAAGNLVITQYTATGPNDPYVTEGTHSMAITFLATGFSTDFQIILNDTNSFLVEQAAASGQIGRYILRYDVIFANPSQYGYFNQQVYIGLCQDYIQISGALTNGLAVYSCALEFPDIQIPAPNSGTNIQMIIADDFTLTNGATLCTNTIYIDNVRLVDTYASTSTIPVIYPLISFKNGGMSAVTNLYPTVTTYYGNPVTARAHLSLYTTNGLYKPATIGSTNGAIPNVCTASNNLYVYYPIPSTNDTDFAVTENDGCALQVSNYNNGGHYQADFAISFAGTKLAQILSQTNLYPWQLAHYTLRWDTTFPGMWYMLGGVEYSSIYDGDYANMTFTTGAAALTMCQARRVSCGQTGLQRDSYSVTLDQIAAWGGSPVGGDPAIIFLFDGQVGRPLLYYFDNFELIDTAPVVPKITSDQYNPPTHQFTLTWTSETGASYTVQETPSLNAPITWSSLQTNITSVSNTATTTVTMPGGNMGFLRILVQ